MCIPMDAAKGLTKPASSSPAPIEVPLGDGLAQRARLAIATRSRRVDEAVDTAQ